MSSSLSVIETSDGSRTLQSSQSNITFRSKYGALTESNHVFVQSSQLPFKHGPWRVLELGLGSGLNFLQTVRAFLDAKHTQQLIYHVVELSPLPAPLINRLWSNQPYIPVLGLTHLIKTLQSLNTCKQSPLLYSCKENKSIELHLYPTHWKNVKIPSLQADAYYHDPFAPTINPNCWSPECFQWSAAHLDNQGLLVTYSAATKARQAIANAGLYVATQPGACGKREMTLAAHCPARLSSSTMLPSHKQPNKSLP